MSEPTVVLTGRLENWYVDVFGRDVIWGSLYDDIHNRWPEGFHIHTSSVPGLDKLDLSSGMVVSTLNSHYLLGKSLAGTAYEKEEAEYVGEGQ
jgi:hypothetical protein